MPAMASSATIPNPPGKDSRRRAGKGFQTSNTRNRANPRRSERQFRCRAPATVIHWPTTSSTTIRPGSFKDSWRAVTSADHIAKGVRISAASRKKRGETRCERQGKKHGRERARCSRCYRNQSTAKPSRYDFGDAQARLRRSRVGQSKSRSRSLKSIGSPGIVYFSVAQFPRSTSRQRSLQNGNAVSPKATGARQIGHCVMIGSLIGFESARPGYRQLENPDSPEYPAHRMQAACQRRHNPGIQ